MPVSLPFADVEDKYEVLHKLGEGGMGEVYTVRHRLLGELRVIKVIRPQYAERPSLRERFRREAQAAIRLRHPNVAQVYDFSIDESGGAYTVMELIDGVTLKQLLARDGPPPLGLTIEIATQALAALGYLHGQGYLHRDIAPDNLMLSRNFDGKPLVKLIDLGLAKRLAGDLDLTSTGMFMGKMRYTSPEQFSRSKEPDVRSDLYSFGIVLYELLTGQCPITGSAMEELVASHLLQPVPPFSETDPEGKVPPELRQIVLRTLEKSPADRVGSAAELAALLAPFRDSGTPAFEDLHDLPHPGAAVPSPRVASRVASRESVGSSKVSTVALGSPGRAARAAPRRGRLGRLALGIALAAVVVTLGVVAAGRWRDAPPPPAHEVLIDAVPWARVESVIDATGGVVASPGEVTPAKLTLEPGTYEVRLSHPSLEQPRTVRLEVPSEAPLPAVEIETQTPDAYFERAGLATTLLEAGS